MFKLKSSEYGSLVHYQQNSFIIISVNPVEEKGKQTSEVS